MVPFELQLPSEMAATQIVLQKADLEPSDGLHADAVARAACFCGLSAPRVREVLQGLRTPPGRE